MSVLPDVLAEGLAVVFCGTAAGARSAELKAYYAGRGNRFWGTLYQMGLTPRQLNPFEFQQVTVYGIGLTDLAPLRSGSDDILRPKDFDTAGLRAKIEQFAPRVLAFVGKRAAQEFLGRKNIPYGQQPETVGPTVIFVLPSTSGAARGYWDPAPWHGLAAYLNLPPR